ncbi:MAG: NAD(P)/FAD-dependent oxidoreductase [Labilithrix sp.]|nr:NAD(P)/FAD-dependent oxidoreductase [Labilithrix sp.]
MDAKRRRVVIVGGGFGGLEAAKALAEVPVDVTLVDRANYHLFQPLLYQVAMAGLSPAEIASPIRAILAEQSNVRVVMGDVSRIDLEEKRVHLEGDELPYDYVIVAVGAKTSYFGNDDWEAFAPGLKNVEDALEIRRRVLVAFERAERTPDARARRKLLTFVVIGGGPTGVELAGAIAELSRHVLGRDFRAIDPREAKVVLIEAGPRILPSFTEDLAHSAVEQLGELGVEVRTGSRVVTIDERGVELEDGAEADELPGLGSGKERERIASETILWAAGVEASGLTRTLGAPLDRQGRVVVGSDCAIPDHPEAFAIGDVARFEVPSAKGKASTVLPGVSPVAMQQARYVAQIIAWEVESDGAPPREPFWYLDKGTMATIGRSRAIADARGLKMRGFIAWLAWLFVHIWYLIGFRNRVVVLLNWAWSYLSYKRGARLITSTGWQPRGAPPSRAPSLPEASRSRESGRPRERAASPSS